MSSGKHVPGLVDGGAERRQLDRHLARDGHRMSPGRAYRLWRAAKLQVPQRRPRKRIASSRPRPQTPIGPNQVWAVDFVFDACANGQQLKCLTVEDEFTKEGLAIEVDGGSVQTVEAAEERGSG